MVSFSDWEKINEVEIEAGAKIDKPREKIVDIPKLLEVALQQ